jgi:hypothetical protein
MAKLKKFKARPSSADIDVIRGKQKESIEDRKKVIDQKFEEKKAYYNNKLIEMVEVTLSSVDEETTPQQLADMLKIGDKEWKSLCATGRKTNKIRVPITLYMETMIANLTQRKILTIPEAQERGEAETFVLTDPLKENEEQDNNIPQDVVEDNNIKENGC